MCERTAAEQSSPQLGNATHSIELKMLNFILLHMNQMDEWF